MDKLQNKRILECGAKLYFVTTNFYGPSKNSVIRMIQKRPCNLANKTIHIGFLFTIPNYQPIKVFDFQSCT